jgi:long-chain acyl-CoA synthetase
VVDRVVDLARLADGSQYSPLLLENKLKFSPYVQEAVVCGDGRDFLVALLTLDGETTGKWAERQGLSFTSYMDLTQKPETRALLGTEVERVNRQVPETLRVRRFLVLPKELDADDDELTRTRKVRRKSVHQRYGDLIDAMYDGARQVDARIAFQYEDGSQQRIELSIAINDAGGAEVPR